MGSASTAKLRYVFPSGYEVKSGASLAVADGVNVFIPNLETIAVNAGAAMTVGATTVTLDDYNGGTYGITVAGTLTATGTTFAPTRLADGTGSGISVLSGGHLTPPTPPSPGTPSASTTAATARRRRPGQRHLPDHRLRPGNRHPAPGRHQPPGQQELPGHRHQRRQPQQRPVADPGPDGLGVHRQTALRLPVRLRGQVRRHAGGRRRRQRAASPTSRRSRSTPAPP